MSLQKTRIAVTGASTVLGREVLNMLAEYGAKASHVTALDTTTHTGEQASFGEDGVVDIHSFDSYDFRNTDIVLHAGDARITAAVAKKLKDLPTLLIDGSGVFAFDPDVPLIVPEVNGALCHTLKKRIIANPNSISIFLALALNPIHKHAPIKRVVASTYQSVSHWGRDAQDELFSQTKAIFMAQDVHHEHLPKQIAFNCYPMVGFERDDNMTDVEVNTMGMLKKIIDPKLKVAINTVTVPCFVGDGIMVNVECAEDISPIKASLWMSDQKGLAIVEDDTNLPSHSDITGEALTFVARMRDDISVENGLSFWLMGDNLRKGSAQNMVDIAVEVTKK